MPLQAAKLKPGRRGYNQDRSHSSLRNLNPDEFARQGQGDQIGEGQRDLRTGDRNDPTQVPGLVDSAIGVARTIESERVCDPLHRVASAGRCSISVDGTCQKRDDEQ
jgi:hypothetical protein